MLYFQFFMVQPPYKSLFHNQITRYFQWLPTFFGRASLGPTVTTILPFPQETSGVTAKPPGGLSAAIQDMVRFN
jgi:hypothetical protein